jgi:hypothetical protein
MAITCRNCGNTSHAPGAQTCQVCGVRLLQATPGAFPAPILIAPRGRQYRLDPTAETFIGRQGCAVTLSDAGVAPRHARIVPSSGKFVLEDLGKGTRVNGAAIGGPVVLQSGDVIGVGRTNLVFYLPEAAAGAPVAQPPKGGAPAGRPARPSRSGRLWPLPSPLVEARLRGEQTLWQGRPGLLLSPLAWLTTRYKLTNERMLVITGLLSQTWEEVELIRVKDIRLEMGCLQRIFSVGTITIFTADQTAPELQLRDVPQAERVREAIRNAVRQERQKQDVRFAELAM